MRYVPLLLALLLAACDEQRARDARPVTVFAAASLAHPLAALADAYYDGTDVVVQRELGGSLEHARKITELGRTPDVLVLAEDEVIAALMPAHIDWYVRFATSRIVVAYGSRSRHADSITAGNWWEILSRAGVSIGRGDSLVAPVGRHGLAVLRRAEPYYARPGLARRLLANATPRHMRANAAELAALLEAGEVDYVLDYEAVAKQHGFRYVTLPLDLAVPVLYGVAVPARAPNAEGGREFVAFMLSGDGRRLLRDAGVELLRLPVALGTNVPSEIAERVRTVAVAR